MKTREERLAEHFRIVAGQGATRSRKQPTHKTKPKGAVGRARNVSNILRARLQKEFNIGCTSCFQKTLTDLDKLSITQIREKSSDFAKAIGENVAEMKAKKVGHNKKLQQWIGSYPSSLDAYERLILDACDSCEVSAQTLLEIQQPTPSRINFDGPIRLQQTSDLEQATRCIFRQLPPTISGVAGVPRSGMYSAALLSMWLHVPLYEVSPQHGLQAIGFGSRGRRIKVEPDSPILVVDDSVYRGGTMQQIRNIMGDRPAIYAAAFVRPESRASVDIVGQLLPSPHLFTWNLFNNGILAGNAANPALHGGMGLDFDGVICEDCPRDGDDTPEGTERYRQWIINAQPKWLPRITSVPLIVTFRQERFRRETEAWMHKWGVTCDRLVMDQSDTFAARRFDVAKHKGDTFRESDCCLFIESNEMQARIIQKVAQKPVIVPDSGRVYQ
jgi:hypothetical protein